MLLPAGNNRPARGGSINCVNMRTQEPVPARLSKEFSDIRFKDLVVGLIVGFFAEVKHKNSSDF